MTAPGGAVQTTTRYPDGRTASVTGSAAPVRYYSYGVNADGSQWTEVRTGAADESGGDKAEFINGIVPRLKSRFPLIKGLVWFDINKEANWRISSSPESEAVIIEMVADPYFNSNQADRVWTGKRCTAK